MRLNLRSNRQGKPVVWHESATWRKVLKSLPKRIASAALELETDDGKLLIVKAHYKAHWSLPSGVIDPGETPLEAAIREAYEEVGLTILKGDVSFSRIVNRASTSADTYQFVFRALLPAGFNESSVTLQAAEIDAWALVSRSDVLKGERDYGKVILDWAHGVNGYAEHTFGA
ncbi:NUDIX hydrolase [Candidatus Saccharibacteria bacterium]|nr:NUDIX hydrolase [Candidatus Saccharibacteria bacterium]